MQITDQQSVGQIVAQDYRAAAVFSTFGIDFCCKGNLTLAAVCEKKNIRQDTLLKKLVEVTISPAGGQPDFRSWPMDLLIDYVEKKHHRYVREKIPLILDHLFKLCKVHGSNHPELFQITEEFSKSAKELAAHMEKEEHILFPYLRKLNQVRSAGKEVSHNAFGTVRNPIGLMMDEHSQEGDRFAKISNLSGNYNAPAEGCTTYRVAFAMLEDFEKDLHMHIHLENNIIFPAAIEMEDALL